MPDLFLFGGPNGAGKTTTALAVLPRHLNIGEFVNADAIAFGLSPLRPQHEARRAGRMMLQRLDALVKARENFAFESTLASRSFAPFLQSCRNDGYKIHLVYVWLHSPQLAIERVAARVKAGGHFIPDDIVRRRYERGRFNFVTLYQPLADYWIALDNSASRPNSGARPVAKGNRSLVEEVYQPEIWESIGAVEATGE